MAGLLAGHSVLGWAFLESSLPSFAVSLALLGLAASAVASHWRWRRMARLHFVLGHDGVLQVIPADGPVYEARATGGCRDLGWAVWLAWRASPELNGVGQTTGILMLPRDALTPEAWRALRIWLKLRSGLSATDVP
jgi:hypothetical protein